MICSVCKKLKWAFQAGSKGGWTCWICRQCYRKLNKRLYGSAIFVDLDVK